MAKARKLQQEIDTLLRKVHDGVDQWAHDWDKLEATEVRFCRHVCKHRVTQVLKWFF